MLPYFLYLLDNLQKLTIFDPTNDSTTKKVRTTKRRVTGSFLLFLDFVLSPKALLTEAEKLHLAAHKGSILSKFEKTIIEFLNSEIVVEKGAVIVKESSGLLRNLLSDYPNYIHIFDQMDKERIILKTKERIMRLYEEHFCKVRVKSYLAQRSAGR